MYEVCDLHAAREYNKDAIAVCDVFIERMSGKQERVLIQLREGARETILQNNRKKLRSITEIIVLCGRQNISLRGHRDSGTDMEGAQAASTNHGNFCAWLIFRISAGDTIIGTTFRAQLEMPHTHPPISRISWSVYLVTTFVMQRFIAVFAILWLQMRSLIAPTRNNSLS